MSSAATVPPSTTSASTGQPGFFSKTQSWFSNFAKGSLPLVIVLITIILLFVIVILWIVFAVKSGKLKAKDLVTNPVRIDNLGGKPIEISGGEIPKPSVGREYSYSFWIYLDDYPQSFVTEQVTATSTQTVPQDKMVFYRGDQNDVSKANPIVTMDGVNNKMYIAVRVKDSTLTAVSNTNLYKIRALNYWLNSMLKRTTPDVNTHIIIPIDYVPLQRWVNVTFIVDNKLCTVYMDGEIYSVKSVDEFKSARPSETDIYGNVRDPTLIVENTTGTVYVGQNNNISGGRTLPGFLSKLRFFNYALSIDDVKTVYHNGPLGRTFFGGLNIPYGVRSPIYKLDQVA
jgi:hypothetical protein